MDKNTLPLIILENLFPSTEVRKPRRSFGPVTRGKITVAVLFSLFALFLVAALLLFQTPISDKIHSFFKAPEETSVVPSGGTTETPSETNTEAPDTDSSDTGEEGTKDTEDTSTPDTDTSTGTQDTADTSSPDDNASPDNVVYESRDMSLYQRGLFYVHNTTINAVNTDAVLSGSLSNVETVLLITSRPEEIYRDGTAIGKIAESIENLLSASGINALYVKAEENTDAQALITYYLNMYPSISLILDLRRSAELSDMQNPIRTECFPDNSGIPAAQLRLICDARGSDSATVNERLLLALRLRAEIWKTAKTASRPVWLREGTDHIPGGIPLLTLEIGALGNTGDEALRSAAIFSDALIKLCKGI